MSEPRPCDCVPACQEPLIFEKGAEGRKGYSLPALDVEKVRPEKIWPANFLSKELEGFPEMSEVEIVRHFTRLSQWNYGVDSGFYPLGSCTMKYNPKVNEDVARLPGFASRPPLPARGALPGSPAADVRAGAISRRGKRHGPGDPAALGRRPGRADGHADDSRLPGRPGEPAARRSWFRIPPMEPTRPVRVFAAIRSCRSNRMSEGFSRRRTSPQRWTKTWPPSWSPTPTPSGCSKRTSARSSTSSTARGDRFTATAPT